MDDDVIHHVEFKKVNVRNGTPLVTKTVRVYEAYWVPEALSKFGFIYLSLWLLSRIGLPFKVLLSNWRGFPALRLASLQRLSIDYAHPGRIEKLERFYRDFENWENRTKYKNGSYAEYLKYVQQSAHPRDKPGLTEAAEKWRLSFRTHLSKVFYLVFFIFLAFLWISALIFFATYIVIDGIFFSQPHSHMVFYGSILLICATILLATFGLKSLGKYVFDVVAWTLESEKDERFVARRKVIEIAQRLIRHVTDDPNCGECYIVSHSLGTCIATEALLREGEREKLSKGATAKEETSHLSKIRAIFTLGSPIDIIFAFFQADRTFSHRYNRLYEEKRHSISLPPFRFGDRAGRTKLINIWSRFDPISSIVLSLRKSVSESRDAIINIESVPSGFPLPISSHVSYFSDPSVMKLLYRTIMLGEDIPSKTLFHAASLGNSWFGPWVNIVTSSLLLSSVTIFLFMDLISLPAVAASATLIWWVLYRRCVIRTYERQNGSFLKR